MAYFWWAVGSQLLVGNPVMGVLFTLYLWRWFFTRIGGASDLSCYGLDLANSARLTDNAGSFLARATDEERLLVKFFGDEYIQYRGDVVSGLPLVR
jgi:protein-S-isoprenylcysteine O-methyltransferase